VEWDGIQDDVTDIADPGVTSVRSLWNGSLVVRGEFSRRPGFGARMPSSGIVCAEIAELVVWVKDDGTIVSAPQ
jgi:hypothetical protein